MELLSDDDQNLKDLTEAELDAAFALWFELAATTDADDPPYTHGVFQNVDIDAPRRELGLGPRPPL